MKTENLTGAVSVAASAVCFGLLGLFNRIASEAGFTVWDRLAIRYIGLALLLLPLLIIKKQSLSIPKGAGKKLLFTSLVGFGLTGAFLFLGFSYTSTGLVTVLHFAYPVVVMVASVALRRERVYKASVISMSIALIGLLLIIAPWKAASIHPAGVIFAIASACTFACYVLMLGDSQLKTMNNMVLLFWLAFFCSIAFLLVDLGILLIAGHGPVDLKSSLPGLLGLVALSSACAFWLFSYGTRKIGGITASVISTIEPMTSVCIGWLILNETVTWSFFVGATLVLAAAAGLSFFRLKQKTSN